MSKKDPEKLLRSKDFIKTCLYNLSDTTLKTLISIDPDKWIPYKKKNISKLILISVKKEI